jgi:hypothetical protein
MLERVKEFVAGYRMLSGAEEGSSQTRSTNLCTWLRKSECPSNSNSVESIARTADIASPQAPLLIVRFKQRWPAPRRPVRSGLSAYFPGLRWLRVVCLAHRGETTRPVRKVLVDASFG